MTGPIPSVAPQRSERSPDFGSLAVRLVGRLTPQRGRTAAVVALAVVGTAIAVIGPRILGQATDQVVAGVLGGRLSAGTTKEQAIQAARSRGDGTFADLLSRMNVKPGVGVDFAAVGGTLLLALGLYLLAALVVWVQARLVNVIVQRATVTLRSDVEDKVHRLPLSYFDSRPRGELLSRVTNDIDNIQTALSTTINQLLTAVLTVIALLTMMLTISPLLAVITLLTVPLSLVVTRQAMRRSQPLFVAQWANTGRLNAHIEETYSGDTLVKTFGLRTWSQEQFRDLNADVYHASFWAQFIAGLLAPATTFIGNLSYVGVAVVGGLQVATGQITVGGIQAFIQYVRQFNQPLAEAAAMTDTLQTGIAGSTAGLRPAGRAGTRTDAAVGLPPFDGRGGRVEFRHVNFELPARYAGDRQPVAAGRAGQHGGDCRADRGGQDDAGESVDAVLRGGFRADLDRRCRHLHGEQALVAVADRYGAAGHLAVRRDDRGEHRLRTAGRDREEDRRGGQGRLRRPIRADPARRL